MFRWTMTKLAVLAALSLIAALAYLQGYSDGDHGEPFSAISSALAAQKPKVTPTGTLHDPSIYFPGTEALAPDEIRLISCGTGMPTARESQAASCWLLELGNATSSSSTSGRAPLRGSRVSTSRTNT
jgi:ribonuclease Z